MGSRGRAARLRLKVRWWVGQWARRDVAARRRKIAEMVTVYHAEQWPSIRYVHADRLRALHTDQANALKQGPPWLRGVARSTPAAQCAAAAAWARTSEANYQAARDAAVPLTLVWAGPDWAAHAARRAALAAYVVWCGALLVISGLICVGAVTAAAGLAAVMLAFYGLRHGGPAGVQACLAAALGAGCVVLQAMAGQAPLDLAVLMAGLVAAGGYGLLARHGRRRRKAT